MHVIFSHLLVSAHGIIDRVPRKTSCLALVTLLLLHPRDDNNLQNHDTPEDAPDRENAFESIVLDDC